ncbi:MAG: uracil phosphoribosyltransferase [Candidatus Marinimicrobia bacterium]|nr:uracil phosphoribosyltransferase [Candidatus Neomarinimicrobiota bacterium]
MQNVQLIDHPLVKHSLTILRDKNTDTETFRRHTAIVSQIIIMEASRSCKLTKKQIETPISETTGYEIYRSMVFVPVLRAGISMLVHSRDFLPWTPVGFIGLERDEETAIAREYYQKFPENIEKKLVLVLDPMLATGGSVSDTIARLKEKGAKRIALACIVAAPEGIKRINDAHPDVHIYTTAIDDHLNEKKYIVPGLGDFGDRYFGT